MLEAYVIQYTPNGTFVGLSEGKPVLVQSIADAKFFHTPNETVLIQHKFNLQDISKIFFVKVELEELKH